MSNSTEVIHDEMKSSSAVAETLKSKPRGRRRRKVSSSGSDAGPDLIACSYSRFSSEMQRDESNLDQQRKCQEAAEANSHSLQVEFEYSDEAVSGTKASRTGLNAMLAAAERGDFQVLYLHSLSRLARESVITMPMLKRLVHSYGVRVICVSEGLDSERSGWELMAAVVSVLHENFIRELSANVHRGQEGIVLAGFAVGDHCFGFSTEEVPGTAGRGRNAKPRKTYVIDLAQAEVVDKIFRWFVEERRSIRWIVRRLNHMKSPKDHRSTTPEWRHNLVVGILSNDKFVGVWPWGREKNVRDPFTGMVSQEPRSDEECERWIRHFPHLQIIDDSTFESAQQRLRENEEALAEHRGNDGRLRGSSSGRSQTGASHLLQGIVKCGMCAANGHDTTLHVGGAGGRYLMCPRNVRGTCDCQTTLRRDRAERMLLNEIGRRILKNEQWAHMVFLELVEVWRSRQQRVPAELAALDRQIAEVDRKIDRLVDRVESGDESPEIARRLSDRREERRTLLREHTSLEREHNGTAHEPTEEWVGDRLAELGSVLSDASPASAEALQRLVGGRITVDEIRREGKKRHFLRGRFSISAESIAQALTGSGSKGSVCDPSSSEEVVIDFVDPDPADAQCEQAKALYDAGLMNVEIAQQLGVLKSRVTALIRRWFEKRGLEMPDGRSRRRTLKRKTQETPLYQRIADDVKELCDRGLLLVEIAEQLQIDRNTVTAAIRFWYDSRGEPVPDGRSRRVTLQRKSRECSDSTV